MKNILKTILVAVSVLLFASCDRSGIFETFDKAIPWNFCVKVVSDANHTQPVAGVTVEIYKTPEDFAAGKVFLSMETNSSGEAFFVGDRFAEKNGTDLEGCKGNYYLKVYKGSTCYNPTDEGGNIQPIATLYLLCNSGTTVQWVEAI